MPTTISSIITIIIIGAIILTIFYLLFKRKNDTFEFVENEFNAKLVDDEYENIDELKTEDGIENK